MMCCDQRIFLLHCQAKNATVSKTSKGKKETFHHSGCSLTRITLNSYNQVSKSYKGQVTKGML